MFYDVYKKLCEEHNEKPFTLAIKLGMKSNSAVAQWKKGSIPRPSMLQKIADYFDVPVGYLIDGESAKKEPAPISKGGHKPETIKFMDEIADFSTEELIKMEEYAQFLKSQRKS